MNRYDYICVILSATGMCCLWSMFLVPVISRNPLHAFIPLAASVLCVVGINFFEKRGILMAPRK